MFALPLHPAIVHIPLGIAAVVPLVMIVLTVALVRRKATRQSFLLAALLQAIVVGGGLVALSTGEAEEERVESVVSERAIERHEELAKVFVAASGMTLALALLAGVAPERWTRRLAVAGTVASIGALGVGVAVGHAGGELVYRHGAATAYAAGVRDGSSPSRAPEPSR